jgi:hypothetical protein
VIEHLKRVNDLNMVLSKMNESDLESLYLRVFSSKDGELLLQDLANRCHVYDIAPDQFLEGQRSVWVSIQTRLRNAVAIKEEQNV